MSKNLKKVDKLKNIIGEELFQRVIEEMPGDLIRLPNDHECYNVRDRHLKVLNDYRTGDLSIDELSKKHNLSKSQIYKITERK